MIKFSWKKINDKFGWNAYSVLEYFFIELELKIPPYLHRKIPKDVRLAASRPLITGNCFLINPDIVFTKATAPMDLYLYIELASRRSIFDYQLRGVKHLATALAEEYQIEWAENCPLFIVKNSNIHFKYEQEKQSDD